MPENTMLYRIGLSLAGALSTGVFGLMVGAAWALATGASVIAGLAAGFVLAAVLGAVTFQLTPTGGVIMQNKTTVNYALVATYGYIAAFFSVAGLSVWAVRSLAF